MLAILSGHTRGFFVGDLVAVAPEVRDRLVVRFGPDVVAWCDELPAQVGRLAARWELELLDAAGGGTARVFRCLRQGEVVWLKMTPDPVVAAEEVEALAAWADSPSVVRLLEQDLDENALLLADVQPGVPLRGRSWEVPAAGALLRDLRTCTPMPDRQTVLRPLAERVDFFYTLTGRRLAAAGTQLEPGLLDKSHSAAMDLATTGPVGLVHGDLHTANVLSGPGGRLVAIDPRAAWGDPDFDALDWALEGAVDTGTVEHRIETLGRLVPGLSPTRVLRWCRAYATVLAVPRICAGRDDEETRFLLALARD